jgi:hypothetical protein
MPPETSATRDRRLSELKPSKHHQWPKADRDAELDEALRELGDEVLKQEIPERLLRLLRSARATDSTSEADAGKNGKRDGS